MIKRLFVASRVRERDALAELDAAWERARELLGQGSWAVRETEPHITMRYLGDIDDGDAANREILSVMTTGLSRTAREHEWIPLILGYLHTFPGVLWASVGGTEDALSQLDRLRFRVKLDVANAEARGLQIEPDRFHPWLPHVTLGRFDADRTEELTQALRESDYPEQAGFHVESLELLESLSRTDGGPEYAPLEQSSRMALRR